MRLHPTVLLALAIAMVSALPTDQVLPSAAFAKFDSIPFQAFGRCVRCSPQQLIRLTYALCRSFRLNVREHSVARPGATFGYTSDSGNHVLAPIADLGSTFYVGRDGTTVSSDL